MGSGSVRNAMNVRGVWQADGVLEAFQELGGEGGGFVEAEAGEWVLGSLVRIDAFGDGVSPSGAPAVHNPP